MIKGVIFDLDLTLVDTTILENARKMRNWIWLHMYLAELIQIMSVWIMSMQWLRQEMECRY